MYGIILSEKEARLFIWLLEEAGRSREDRLDMVELQQECERAGIDPFNLLVRLGGEDPYDREALRRRFRGLKRYAETQAV